MTTRRALFIVNPLAGAGQGQARWERFRAAWSGSEAFPVAHVLTHRPAEAMELAREHAPQFEILFAVGGDGTAFEIASGILSSANPTCALGVVPTGTGNDIGTALGLRGPQDVAKAVQDWNLQTLDAIRVECCSAPNEPPVVRHALLFAAVGIASECLKQTTASVKRVCGERMAYRLGLLRALWAYRSPMMRIMRDEETHEGRFLLVCASNCEYAGGGMRLAPGARMDDGQLNLSLVEAMSRWRALPQVRRVCRGRHLNHGRVQYRPGKRLSIQAEAPLEVAADGELIGYTPAVFEVAPKALRTLVLGR